MKSVKILGLLAVAAAAVMAFAGTASATILTSPTGTVYTGKIVAHSEGTTSLDGAFTTVSCSKSNVEGPITGHGAGVTVKGTVEVLTFTECNFPVTVLKKGTLELHPMLEKEEGGKKVHTTCPSGYCTGTLTSSGAEISIATSIGTCVFTTTNTGLGTVTPTNDTGGHATLDIGSSPIPRTGGNFLCGSSGTWTGAYTVTQPSTLWINP